MLSGIVTSARKVASYEHRPGKYGVGETIGWSGIGLVETTVAVGFAVVTLVKDWSGVIIAVGDEVDKTAVSGTVVGGTSVGTRLDVDH